IAALTAVLAAAAYGQTTFASITGAVTDQNGAVMAGVTVEVVQKESNYKYTAKSNEAGIFTIAQLREGVYNLRASMPGFKEAAIQNIQLVALDVRRVDVRMEVGAVETRVEVAANSTVIETETARISDSKGADMLKSLPLNTRSLSSFLAL